jgi:hypothetical protein
MIILNDLGAMAMTDHPDKSEVKLDVGVKVRLEVKAEISDDIDRCP